MGSAKQRVPKNELQSQVLQILDRVGAITLGGDTGAVLYNCDPQANHRAIEGVNELCRLGLLTGTRQEAIEAVWRELDKAIKQAEA